eukprot:6155504-Amphidinium_carterae.1
MRKSSSHWSARAVMLRMEAHVRSLPNRPACTPHANAKQPQQKCCFQLWAGTISLSKHYKSKNIVDLAGESASPSVEYDKLACSALCQDEPQDGTQGISEALTSNGPSLMCARRILPV